MRLRKYSYLFLLLMFCLCITACGNSSSSSGNKSDDILPTVVTTDFSSNFEDTYWVNKDANIGYYFKDGYITSITFGEKETAKYTISASEITANGNSISYQLLGDTLVLTLDGISLNFTKSTKDDFNALSPDSSGNASRLINSYWVTEPEYAAYHFTADKMTVAVFGSEVPFLCVIDDKKIVAGPVTYTYTFTDTGLTLFSDEESTIRLLPSTKEVFESYVNKGESETPAGSKTDYIGMTIEDFADTGVEITDYKEFGGKVTFYGYNHEKRETYEFELDSDPLALLEEMDFMDDYEDVLEGFKIAYITVSIVDDSPLQKYVGKTLKDLINDNYHVSGFMKFFNTLTFSVCDESNTYVEVILEDSALDKYNSLEDPFEADMEKEFADFKINKIVYALN